MKCNGPEIVSRQFVSPIHLQLQGAQWLKVTKVDEIFEIFDKVGDVSYRIVAGNTGQGKEPLICPYLFISLFTFYILHNEKLNDLYSSPSIVQVIKSRRMRWAQHVACMGKSRAIYSFLWGKLTEREHLGNPGVDGKIILRWIFIKWDVGVWAGSSWLRIGTGGGHL
jgi:hypothetical protein